MEKAGENMRYVIIGGDAAGMSAAMQIVKHDQKAQITTLEEGGIYSYAQCGLPYYIGGLIHDTDNLIARSIDTFRSYGIDARVRVRATRVDPVTKTVEVLTLEDGKTEKIPYDKLLIATGARPLFPDWENASLKNIFTLKTIPDAKKIRGILTPAMKKAVIIGGGYIGLEVAEALKHYELEVRIIQRSGQLGTQIDPDMATGILEEAKIQGVDVTLNESVSGFKGSDRVTHVVTDQETYEADIVLAATGVTPNTDFLPNAFDTLDNGALKVDRHLRTSVEDVYAAGDCATQYHRIKKAADFVPLGTHANKMGRIAGMNMTGIGRSYGGMVGTSVMKFFDITVARTGLTEKEAKQAGFTPAVQVVDTHDKTSYYPKHEPLKVKLIADRPTGKILGGQAIGRSGADKRIDVLATALYSELTVDDLQDLDLSYAPPYNSVWDPFQKAARQIW